MLDLLLSGSRWFQLALLCALVATAKFLRPKGSFVGGREPTLSACNRFYGTVMAVMATGHLFAVTLLRSRGALSSGASLPLLYAVGVVLLVPAAWLAAVAPRLGDEADGSRRPALVLNALLAVVLVASVGSAPLAVPAMLNVVLLRKPGRRALCWGVAASGAAYLAMFVASLVFREL